MAVPSEQLKFSVHGRVSLFFSRVRRTAVDQWSQLLSVKAYRVVGMGDFVSLGLADEKHDERIGEARRWA